MLLALLAFLAVSPAGAAEPQPAMRPVLTRIAEEADAFEQNITKALTQETLVQRSIESPSRFHLQVGQAAEEAPKVHIRTREIVSEYSIAGLHDSPAANLVEFRQVISVDGKKVQSMESARRALSLGMQSEDDRLRKRMLEEFAKYGLVDIATDYGPILLAFSKRGLENMEIEPAGQGRIGADLANIFSWRQKTPEGGELEFHGKMAAHRALSGTIWVRASDNL